MPEPLPFGVSGHQTSDDRVDHPDDVTWTPVPESASAEAVARIGNPVASTIRISIVVSGVTLSGGQYGWILP